MKNLIPFENLEKQILAAFLEGRINANCSKHSLVGFLLQDTLEKECHDLYDNAICCNSSFKIDNTGDFMLLKKKVRENCPYELADLLLIDQAFRNTYERALESTSGQLAEMKALSFALLVLKEIHNALIAKENEEARLKELANRVKSLIDGRIISIFQS